MITYERFGRLITIARCTVCRWWAAASNQQALDVAVQVHIEFQHREERKAA